jgi:hypothetical protein
MFQRKREANSRRVRAKTSRSRVNDFGLAKNLAGVSELTKTGQTLGAPSFIPPEQAAGRKEDVGPRSDV